jgi:hypothetical protein
MAPTEEGHVYHPKDALGLTFSAAWQAGAAGALFAGIQNTLTKRNVGASGFFTVYGGTTATFSTYHSALAMGGKILTHFGC